MDQLSIERLGGLAGFGGAAGRLKSRGAVDVADLSPTDRAAVDALFAAGGAASSPQDADGFRYRLTRQTPDGPRTIEAPHAALPAALVDSVRDTLD